MKPPATVIVGEVVGLRDKLSWFERLPLFGQKIVVTRARETSRRAPAQLRALGADVLELPVIALEPPADPGPLDAAIQHLETYDWIFFTSVNGVKFFTDRLDASQRDLRAVRARLCARAGYREGPAVAAPQGGSDTPKVRRRKCCRSVRKYRSEGQAHPAAPGRRSPRSDPFRTSQTRSACRCGRSLPQRGPARGI